MNITVTYAQPGSGMAAAMPFPPTREAWRKLLGGPIDIHDCRYTFCPCAVVYLVQSGRVANMHGHNPLASEFVEVNVFGPAVLVAGASAVDLLDEQFEGWEGDEPEEVQAQR